MCIFLYIILLIIAVPVLFFLFSALVSLLIDNNKVVVGNRLCCFIINSTVALLFPILRTNIHVNGMEKLPKEPFMLVSNHVSNFDPIVMMKVLRKRKLLFVSKPQNMHVPVYGKIIHRYGYLSIDRENPKKAIDTLNTASGYIKDNGFIMGIYPEGTRSKDGLLHSFHSFVFRTAKLADCPVVVMTIRGTKDIQKNFPLKGANVYVNFIDVFDRDYVNSHMPAEISDRAYNLMLEDLNNGLSHSL